MAVKKATTIKKTTKKTTDVKKTKSPKKDKVVSEKKVKNEVIKKDTVSVKKNSLEKYYYAVGRRKTSIAQVRMFENEKATDNDFIINGKKLRDYFPAINHQNVFIAPLKTVGLYGKTSMTILVKGGGFTGQVEAIQLGIARAIVKFNEEFKKPLKDMGFLTRDSRKVERKKAGLKKARKSPQWAKR